MYIRIKYIDIMYIYIYIMYMKIMYIIYITYHIESQTNR